MFTNPYPFINWPPARVPFAPKYPNPAAYPTPRKIKRVEYFEDGSVKSVEYEG